jgi:anti-sigma B factor antagonist
MAEDKPAVEVVCGVPVVTAPEEIDISNAAGLRTALLDASARGHGTFVVDMSQTRFCDSAGVHALVRAHNRSQAEGGKVLLAISASEVRRLFAITGIDRLIPSFPSLQDALEPTARSGGSATSRLGAALSRGRNRLDRALNPAILSPGERFLLPDTILSLPGHTALGTS